MGALFRFKLPDFVARYKLGAFVETGTARGDSLALAAQCPEFTRLLSCEIEPLLAAGACCRFNEDLRVSILRMESSLFMRLVCGSDMPPAFFWLDAHYPGAGFGLAEYDEAGVSDVLRLPLAQELDQIRARRSGGDVILIDDLRIYETGDWADGPLPDDAPGTPTPGGADWMREMFADTHVAKTLTQDQGYLLMLPKG